MVINKGKEKVSDARFDGTRYGRPSLLVFILVAALMTFCLLAAALGETVLATMAGTAVVTLVVETVRRLTSSSRFRSPPRSQRR